MSKISLKHSGGNVVSLNSPTSAPTSSDVAFKLPNADGTSGQAIVTDASGNLSFATVAGGKLLQLKSATKTDTASVVANATPQDISGLSITITPASASSKFYITGKVQMSLEYATTNGIHINVNGSVVGNADTSGSRPVAHTGTGYMGVGQQYSSYAMAIDFLVNASDANAHTIKLQMSQADESASRTLFINRSQTDPNSVAGPRYTSTLTVMEIAP